MKKGEKGEGWWKSETVIGDLMAMIVVDSLLFHLFQEE